MDKGKYMSTYDEYRALYEKNIVKNARILILTYNAKKQIYEYKPYSHQLGEDAIDKLSELIIDNLVFYAFSEDEVVNQNKMFGLLDNLKNAARYACKERLPKRINANTDGTFGEVLLDVLIQVFEKNSQKLIARAKYKQLGDNSEIKGYDALYFTKFNDEITLWLGQVKTGSFDYCKREIVTDLNEKYIDDYFCNSLYYIADKCEQSGDLIYILNEINKICYLNACNKYSDIEKNNKIFELLAKNKVRVKIPCLLVYQEDIYTCKTDLSICIDNSIKRLMKILDKEQFNINLKLTYEIVFIAFPVKDIKRLRENLTKFKKG